MTRKISIICPMYNSLPYLKAMIDSLKAQTESDFEVIIVDDHSTDGSFLTAKSYTKGDGRFRFLQTPYNSGPGVARNIGINAAEGKYISFIDSDDQYHPDYLKRMLDAVTGGKDLAYCQLKYCGGKKIDKIHRNPVVSAGDFTKESKYYFLKHFVTFSVCFIYNRKFLLQNRLYFPELYNSEDTNFLIKNILLAKTVACVDDPLYLYIIHDDSLTMSKTSRKYRDRFLSMNLLMSEFGQMKRNPQFTDLHLKDYTCVMHYLWLKKGLLLSIIEFFKCIIK